MTGPVGDGATPAPLEFFRQMRHDSQDLLEELKAELEDRRRQLRIAEEVVSKGIISRQEALLKRQAAEELEAKVRQVEENLAYYDRILGFTDPFGTISMDDQRDPQPAANE